jgi:hypothetical protein
VSLVRKVLVKGVPAAVAIVIVIAGGADAEVARAAAREVTVVATPAVVAADVEEGRISSQ